MGIPSYFKKTIENYPEIIFPSEKFNNKKNLNNKRSNNNLFLDLNCAIHPCCAGKTDENEMKQSILEKIQECVEITGVDKLLYIAIDGPAPRTKMEQQRQRRLRSFHENKIWDTNQITPGTRFMNDLNIFLKDNLENLKKNNLKIVLSDSNEPGEGEQKIMKYMDLNCNINDVNIVYGLDADLMMLSMIRKHRVYLLRERTAFNFEGLDTDYVFLDINLLKQSIIETLKKSFVKVSNETLLHDYLFMCFFIGNDFIINSPSINIRYSGLDRLLEIYNELQHEYFGRFYFIDLKEKNKINENNLKLFINKLAETENESLKDILKIRGNQQNKYRRIYNDILKNNKTNSITEIQTLTHEDFGTSVDRFDDFKNHSPVILRNDEDEIVLNDKKYYLHNFYNTNHYDPSFQMMLEEDKKTLCHEYIKSIVWTTQYYFGECPSWRWYYKYHFAPLFCDLQENIDLSKIEFLNEQEKNPYSPEEQLKIVLPCQDSTYLYPKYTPLHSLMKRYFWECHPIMIN